MAVADEAGPDLRAHVPVAEVIGGARQDIGHDQVMFGERVRQHTAANVQIVGVEPEAGDDATRSFRTGILHTVDNPPTIADGTRTPSLGQVTFPLVLEYVDDMRTVTEDAIIRAVQFLFYRMKLVVEPSGALGERGDDPPY